MPSQRKRIGFLPSEEVQDIIDQLCRANKFSQSKVTGLLVEEALRTRGVMHDSLPPKRDNKDDFKNYNFENEPLSNENKSRSNNNVYAVNKQSFSEEINMMHEFIEFKYFKKVMQQNKNFFE